MSSEPAARCPKCGFAYAWDGNCCRHCKHGVEDDLLSRYLSLEELQEVLLRMGPADDELVVTTFWRYLPSYNYLWSAGYVLGAAGLVCYHRPHLAERILVRPIGYLFDLGAQRAEHVLCWADSRLPDRLDALEAQSESIMDTPRAILADFAWFHPWPFNPNACLASLFRDLVRASGDDAEGFEWLKANLPRYRDFIQSVLDRFRTEREQRAAREQRVSRKAPERGTSPGACMVCGEPLGFWARVLGRVRHRRCESDPSAR
jgi:hypothetical protein